MGGRNGSRVATLAYAVVWLLAAAVIVGIVLSVLDSGEPDEVSLPPVQETELAQAARQAHCELRRARDGEALESSRRRRRRRVAGATWVP